jgi:hypothetical protein
MKRILAACVTVSAILLAALAAPTLAQSNDNDNTPLGSRIRHARQFPFDPPANRVPLEKMSKVQKDQSRAMMNLFSKCVYNRSRTGALELLDKTDFGFADFKQIGLDNDKAAKIYGFHDCLGRVAERNETGVEMRYNAPSLRQWVIQAAYLETYAKGPTWIRPGYVIAAREYPLSAGNPGVQTAMDFADCVVAADPYSADYLFRTVSGTPEEKEALAALEPSLGPCLPQGLRIRFDPDMLRVWMGEALWQAANHSVPAPAEEAKPGG